MKKNIKQSEKESLTSMIKSLESRLQKSEEKYNKLFRNAPNSIVLVDQNMIIYDCNETSTGFFGYSRDEVIGKSIASYYHKSNKKNLEQEFDLLKKKGHLVTKSILKHKNGSLVHVSHSINALYDDNGIFSGAIILNCDITAIKDGEEIQRRSEEKFKILFDFAPDPYFTMNLKGTILNGNSAAEKLIGYRKEELIGQNMIKSGLLIPSDIPRALARLAAYSAGRKQKGINLRLIKKDKSIIEIEIFTTFIKHENETIVLNIARNRTIENLTRKRLLKSEKKYRDLFEKSKDAILIIDDGRFVDCNKATVEMLGYRKKSEILESHPSELSPELQPDGKNSLEKAEEMMSIAYKKGSHRFEWDHKKANGDVFPVEVLLTAIDSDNDKELLHTVWRDITERKEAEQELSMYHNQLEEIIKERTSELEKANTSLIERNKKLEHYNDLFVGREHRIKELRDKVKEMEEQLENNK